MPFARYTATLGITLPPGVAAAFWAGLAFAILAPLCLSQLISLLDTAVSAFLRSADPWNIFGPGPTLDTRRLHDLASRRPMDWGIRIGVGLACATAWIIAHLRATRIAPFAEFAGEVATVLAAILLVLLIGSPIYTLAFDPVARQMHQYLPPTDGMASVVEYLMISWRWLATSFHPSIQSPLPLPRTAVDVLLPTVFGTWGIAWLIARYARSRSGSDDNLAVALARDIGHMCTDLLRAVARLVRPDQTATPDQRVARAVARPWLIPAGCALVYIVANGIANLFPIVVLLAALFAYVATRGIWRCSQRLGLTRFALGGAVVGFGSAVLVGMICVSVTSQGWVLNLRAKPPVRLSMLVTLLPSYIAFIASLAGGLRRGWRLHG